MLQSDVFGKQGRQSINSSSIRGIQRVVDAWGQLSNCTFVRSAWPQGRQQFCSVKLANEAVRHLLQQEQAGTRRGGLIQQLGVEDEEDAYNF